LTNLQNLFVTGAARPQRRSAFAFEELPR
jgi:hypothetical protein